MLFAALSEKKKRKQKKKEKMTGKLVKCCKMINNMKNAHGDFNEFDHNEKIKHPVK